MTYIALTFWFLVIVLQAWGVHQLWCGLIQRRFVNAVLLPGTLIAQLGHVFGLLITGARVSNTSLYSDDSGDPETTRDSKPRIPVVGPIVIALLPLVACAVALFFIARFMGQPILTGLKIQPVEPVLPTSLSALFDLLRNLLSLAENLIHVVGRGNFTQWTTWLFLYLVICLTIRMAPFPGFLRSSLGAILVLGIGGAMVAGLLDVADPRIRDGWAVMNLAVGFLLVLLMFSLIVRGTVGLIKLLKDSNA